MTTAGTLVKGIEMHCRSDQRSIHNPFLPQVSLLCRDQMHGNRASWLRRSDLQNARSSSSSGSPVLLLLQILKKKIIIIRNNEYETERNAIKNKKRKEREINRTLSSSHSKRKRGEGRNARCWDVLEDKQISKDGG